MPPILSKFVCQIKPMLTVRSICGLYNHTEDCSKRQKIIRIYCLIAPLTFTGIYATVSNSVIIFDTILISSEYLLQVILSQWNGNVHVLEYYSRNMSVDKLMGKRMISCLENLIYGATSVMLTIKLIMKGVICFKYAYMCSNKVYVVMELAVKTFAMVARLSPTAIFTLMYYRMKTFLNTLENEGFTETRKFDFAIKYINMYETLMDGFEKADETMKIQFLMSTVFTMPLFVINVYYFLSLLKENGPDAYIATCFVFDTTYTFGPYILSAILSDLITESVNQIKRVVLENRIASKNERDCAEIQKLFQLLKSRPYKYTLWGVASLSVRSLLGFFSYCTTTIIAILQIKTANN